LDSQQRVETCNYSYPGAKVASYTNSNRTSIPGISCLGVKLTVFLYTALRLRMNRAVTQVSFWLAQRQRVRIILRWIFRKWDVGVWTGWSWLRIGTVGVHL